MLRRLWVIGDSWTDPGWGGWGWQSGWPTLVSRRLGLTLVNSGRGGAGYVNPNGEGWTYPREVTLGGGYNADAVIIWGSINDSAWPLAQLRTVSAQVMTAVRAACPSAALLVYGPQYWDTQPWPGMALMTAEVRASAQEAGALFIDPLLWMQGRADLIDKTGHPTQDGHRLLADRVEVDLLWAMGPARRPPEGAPAQTWQSPLSAAAATLLEDA